MSGAAPGVAVTPDRALSATLKLNGGAGLVLALGAGGGQGEPAGLSFPTMTSSPSVNQRLLSGPVTMPLLPRLVIRGSQYSLIVPLVVTRPILSGAFGPLRAHSVNQSAPSGPFVMSYGALPELGVSYSVITPAGVMRPIFVPGPKLKSRW